MVLKYADIRIHLLKGGYEPTNMYRHAYKLVYMLGWMGGGIFGLVNPNESSVQILLDFGRNLKEKEFFFSFFTLTLMTFFGGALFPKS